MPIFRILVAVAAATALLGGAALADTQLVGAGATFPYPFYSRAFYEYGRVSDRVSVNYQSIGSGGGIQQFIAKTVDFGASDVPLNAAETKTAEAAGGAVVQVPATLGGEAIAYNLPGGILHLRLSPAVLAGIYLGKITKWNDPAIVSLNFGARMPDMPIVVVHRADGSGTTYIFTDYLSHVSSEWKQSVGTGKVVSWPAPSAVGAKGNEGVAGQVRNTPGAIGYIELAYALQNDIAYAALQNRAGKFVLPSIQSIQTAAAQKSGVNPKDYSIVDQSGADSYPICGYSWIMLWQNQPEAARGRRLVALFRWLVTTGQEYARSIQYVPLPATIQSEATKALASIHT